MIASTLETAARCDRHVGEAFAPRCRDCDDEAASLEAAKDAARPKAYKPGTECSIHRFYPLPCDRCERDTHPAPAPAPELGDSTTTNPTRGTVTAHGFPPRTPLADMTEREQLAYWKHHARRHEFNAQTYVDQLHDVRRELRSGNPRAALAMIAADLPRPKGTTTNTTKETA